MTLAHHAGIATPKVDIVRFGTTSALIVERFDRQYGDQGEGKYIRDGASFPRLFAVKTVNDEAYRLKLLQWMTFNILTRNYDAHGKNISFFVSQKGLEPTPFYDLVNIEAILVDSERLDPQQNDRQALSGRTYAMSIGEYEAGTEGNFQPPFTAYMLADFAHSFQISLPRIQLVMEQMITRVLQVLEVSRKAVFTKQLSTSEKQHVNLCIRIIKAAADELLLEVKNISSMANLL